MNIQARLEHARVQCEHWRREMVEAKNSKGDYYTARTFWYFHRGRREILDQWARAERRGWSMKKKRKWKASELRKSREAAKLARKLEGKFKAVGNRWELNYEADDPRAMLL